MVRASTIVAITGGVAVFGVISFLPLYMRVVIGSSAVGSGQVFTPLMVAMVASAIVVSRVVIRLGYRLCLSIGFAVMIIGAFALVRLDVHATQFDVTVALAIIGFGMGFVNTPTSLAVQSSVDVPRMGVSMGVINFVRQLGSAVGIAGASAIVLAGLTSRIADAFPGREVDAATLLNPVRLDGATGGAASDAVRQAFADSIHAVFLLTLVILVIGAFSVLLMPRGSATELRDEAQAGFVEELEAHPEERDEYGIDLADVERFSPAPGGSP
jgi:MFS family permease